MIEIKNINKYFHRHQKNQIHVINNTTISLPDNGLVAILGESGSGKTTLLNTIGGLDKVTSGEIYINDAKITSQFQNKVDNIRNALIGYIFQDFHLIDQMSVFDNISLVLKMIGIKDQEQINNKVSYVLERVGMYRYRNRYASMLSGGERQRVAIARAIVKNPAIIIADEPTGNLDSKNTIEIMNIIKSISKTKLVLLVTHEKEIANFYADQIIKIEDGKIISNEKNNITRDLDYHIENKLYLKDIKNHYEIKNSKYQIDLYNDETQKINVTIVIKNNNIYIDTNEKYKVEPIDSNSNIELIDDHYQKIKKEEYLNYQFDQNKLKNTHKVKYTSIFNLFTLFKYGIKKIIDYSIIKKLLLFGFFISAMFVLYSVSNISGTKQIKEEDYLKQNKEYLIISGNNIKVDNYLNYEQNKLINYIIPGNSIVKFTLKYNDYYQTSKYFEYLSGSLTSIDVVMKEDLIYGTMPTNNQEIVVDKMAINNMFKSNMAIQAGISNPKDLIGKKVEISHMPKFTIVGITDKHSPSIYTHKDQFINIIANSKEMLPNSENIVIDYELKKDIIKLVKGRYPLNDYEVIINNKYEQEMKLNKETNYKINGKKLKVVGYYSDPYSNEYLLVNENTIKYQMINENNNISIYPNNKERTLEDFRERKINIEDASAQNKREYLNFRKTVILSTIITSIIIIAISLIEIFLIIRSSFLSRIKEVGTYRAIGIKKKDIYKMFLGEILAITTIASIPGYLFMMYVINKLSNISYLKGYFLLNFNVSIISLTIIYGFNIIIGLLPVFNTLRKTPAAILSRTDID